MHMLESQAIVRINGVLPNISTLGDEEKSERAAEVKRTGMTANTSCSILVRDKKNMTTTTTTSSSSTTNNNKVFHLLVDVGQGVVKSLEKIDLSPYPDFNSLSSDTTIQLPDAILITHSHDDHVKDLPSIISKIDHQSTRTLKIFCTKECHEQLMDKFPELSKTNNNNRVSFNIIQHNGTFEVGPISAIPISVYHGDNSPPGSVIYILKLPHKRRRKVIIGWDFLSLPDDVDENLFWNPDLVILGTQSFNPHPETGLISISDAFELVRRWNAKECYIVHYRGLMDFKEARNQWFRGPTKAMNSEELQKIIDENLRVTGRQGKFKITVAQEGMMWAAKDQEGEVGRGEEEEKDLSQLSPIGSVLEIESLQNYILTIEKDAKNDGMLKLIIEDRIKRFDLRFINPHMDTNNNNDILYAQGEKGMLAKGPELKMEILPSQSLVSGEEEEASILRVNVYKGKKTTFKDDILISKKDTEELRRYIRKNFVAVPTAI
jgi:phosphoribosyl 1,2-cyclic phosphodiesterase